MMKCRGACFREFGVRYLDGGSTLLDWTWTLSRDGIRRLCFFCSALGRHNEENNNLIRLYAEKGKESTAENGQPAPSLSCKSHA